MVFCGYVHKDLWQFPLYLIISAYSSIFYNGIMCGYTLYIASIVDGMRALQCFRTDAPTIGFYFFFDLFAGP